MDAEMLYRRFPHFSNVTPKSLNVPKIYNFKIDMFFLLHCIPKSSQVKVRGLTVWEEDVNLGCGEMWLTVDGSGEWGNRPGGDL